MPAVVTALAADGALTPVWRNELGGLTFRLDGPDGATSYVKWVAAATPEIDLIAEAERLAWAQTRVAVPPVLAHGRDAAGTWLVTAAVPGRSAIDPSWAGRATEVAAGIGRGLRLLHDGLPVDECPFDWSLERRLRRADERIAASEGPEDWFPEHRHLDPDEARARLSAMSRRRRRWPRREAVAPACRGQVRRRGRSP